MPLTALSTTLPDDEAGLTVAQRKRRRASTIAQLLQKGGSSGDPVYGIGQGLVRVAQGAMGGYLEGKEERDAAERQRQAGAAVDASMKEALAAGVFGSRSGGGSLTGPTMAGATATSVPPMTGSAVMTPAAPAGMRAGASGSAGAGGGAAATPKFSGGQSDFIKAMLPHAIAASQQTGVDPRLIVAQSAIETGWGRSAPGNNYFGIKGPGQSLATKEVVGGQTIGIKDSFRTFNDMGSSAQGYADFINKNPRYGGLKSAQGLDAQASALQRSGYATDPNYGNKVLGVARGIKLPGDAPEQPAAAPLPPARPMQSAGLDPNDPRVMGAEFASDPMGNAQVAAELSEPTPMLAPAPVVSAGGSAGFGAVADGPALDVMASAPVQMGPTPSLLATPESVVDGGDQVMPGSFQSPPAGTFETPVSIVDSMAPAVMEQGSAEPLAIRVNKAPQAAPPMAAPPMALPPEVVQQLPPPRPSPEALAPPPPRPRMGDVVAGAPVPAPSPMARALMSDDINLGAREDAGVRAFNATGGDRAALVQMLGAGGAPPSPQRMAMAEATAGVPLRPTITNPPPEAAPRPLQSGGAPQDITPPVARSGGIQAVATAPPAPPEVQQAAAQVTAQAPSRAALIQHANNLITRGTEAGHAGAVATGKLLLQQAFQEEPKPDVEVRELNGRLVTVDKRTLQSRDVTPQGLPSGYRPMSAEERTAGGIPAGVPAFMGPDGKPQFGPAGTNVSVNTAGESEFSKGLGKGASEFVNKAFEEGGEASDGLRSLAELRKLGQTIDTGGWAVAKSQLAKVGVKLEGADKLEAYEALVNRLTPQQRVPGSGTTSDFDAKMFRGSLPALINTPGGNEMILNGMEAIAKNRLARSEVAGLMVTEQLGRKEGFARLMDLQKEARAVSDRLAEAAKGGATPAAAAPALKPIPADTLAEARETIKRTNNPKAVMDRLRASGFDPSGL